MDTEQPGFYVKPLDTKVVQMLVDANFISLEIQYIDGTKIEANANKYTFICLAPLLPITIYEKRVTKS